MLETNSDYNVTRIHTHEFSVLMENTFDLALEVGVGISQKNKQMLGHIPHFVRIQYGHEYRLDQVRTGTVPLCVVDFNLFRALDLTRISCLLRSGKLYTWGVFQQRQNY